MMAFCVQVVFLWGQRNGDYDHVIYTYPYASAAVSKVEGLPATIIPDRFPKGTYEIAEDFVYAAGLGIGLKGLFSESNFLWRADFNYLRRLLPKGYLDGGDYRYNDIEGLEYRILLDYDRSNISAQLGYYILGQNDPTVVSAYLAFGPSFSPYFRSRINYHTNRPDNLTHDLRIQADLEQHLHLRNDIALLITAGFEFGDFDGGRIELALQAQIGMTDILETTANGFDFIEHKNNRTLYLQATLGYLIKWNP